MSIIRKIVAIIPVRMASTRFPGKPLASIMGLPMVEHVRRRVGLCKDVSRVVVATCDVEIREAVKRFGGEVVMTSDKHERCTERVAEAAASLDADIVVNVQGDEPLIMPHMIFELVKPMLGTGACECANLVSPITDDEESANPNVVKTVFDLKKNILYFSREPIPSSKKAKEHFKRYKQLGIIAFSKSMLLRYVSLRMTPIEITESIDMMRLLEHGYSIKAVVTEGASCGVDTPEDLKKAEVLMKKDIILKEYLRSI